MNQFAVLTKREFLQMGREYKLIWLPLVFILLGITQPLISYFLPQILDAVGGAEGIIIDPEFTAQRGEEILAGTLASQFNQLGIIIIGVSMMMIVQGDKESGMLAFILTKPVSIGSYIASKLIANYLVVAGSVGIGYFVSYIYTNLYFTTVPFKNMFIALLIYFIWVFVMISFTTMISTIFKSQSIIGIISIVILLLWVMVGGVHPTIDLLSPASMSNYAMEMLLLGSVQSKFIWSLLINLGWILLTIYCTYYWTKNKKFAFGNE